MRTKTNAYNFTHLLISKNVHRMISGFIHLKLSFFPHHLHTFLSHSWSTLIPQYNLWSYASSHNTEWVIRGTETGVFPETIPTLAQLVVIYTEETYNKYIPIIMGVSKSQLGILYLHFSSTVIKLKKWN